VGLKSKRATKFQRGPICCISLANGDFLIEPQKVTTLLLLPPHATVAAASRVTPALPLPERCRPEAASNCGMKIHAKFLPASFLAAACCIALSLSVAHADDGVEGGDDVQGNESLDLEVAMAPTLAAPAGATAKVSLEAEDDNGSTGTKLEIEAQGLPAGIYSANITLKSDGSTVALGTLSSDGGGDVKGKFETEQGNFPPNVNPFDIATISLLDANNVVLFMADLTNSAGASAMTRTATVQATAGPANPGATGDAMLNAFLARGVAKGSLQLNGHGISPNLPLNVAVNGIVVKNARSDKMGNVIVRLTPKGKTGTVAPNVSLFRVSSISLMSKVGTTILNASF
jgi:hypothetical protein